MKNQTKQRVRGFVYGMLVGAAVMGPFYVGARNDANEWQGCYDRLWNYCNPTPYIEGGHKSHSRHSHHFVHRT